MIEIERIKTLYGKHTDIITSDSESTVYKMENETGEGLFTLYNVFPGIELIYNDVHLSDATEENKRPLPDVMEINHCREGRFECGFPTGNCAYLGKGDLAINMLSNHPQTSWFPLAHYHGVSIIADIPVANKVIGEVSRALGGMPIDLCEIRDKLCGDNQCFIVRAAASIEHIFAELYTVPDAFRKSYLKLKVMELFLFLGSTDFSEQKQEYRYFPKSQVQIIRAVEAHLAGNLDRRITLEELSRRFAIPVSSLKLCFKGVYGANVSEYMQQLRLETARKLLRDTDTSIMLIAQRVGYKNASKFTESFRAAYGDTPTEYRKINSSGE